jgi:hypothetical protein
MLINKFSKQPTSLVSSSFFGNENAVYYGDQKFEPKILCFLKVLKDNADFKSYRP